MPGRMIAIVGTSSVGKTTVAEHLQAIMPSPYLVVGLDHFLNMFPQRWSGQDWGPGPGMWYHDTVDPQGRPLTRIRFGDAGARLLAGMRAAVRALLDTGNDIILDEMPLDETILPAWRRELADYDVFWVWLHAPLDVVEHREAQRTRGQKIGNARGHVHLTAGGTYDLELDVSTLTPAAAAEAILAGVRDA